MIIVMHHYIYIGKHYEYLFMFYFNWIFPKDKNIFICGENLKVISLFSFQFLCAFAHKTQALRSSFSGRKINNFWNFPLW